MKDLWPAIVLAVALVVASLIITWGNIRAAEAPVRQLQTAFQGLFSPGSK